MFKSSTCYGRTCRLLGKSKAKYILWREGKGESKDSSLRRRRNGKRSGIYTGKIGLYRGLKIILKTILKTGQGPAAKQTAGPCPVTGFVVSYNY